MAWPSRYRQEERAIAENGTLQKPEHSAVGDIAWVAAFQLVVYVMGLVLVPVLTRVLSPESYGAWMQARTTIVLLAPVLSLSLGNAIVRFLSAEEDPGIRQRAVGAMLLPVLTLGALVLVTSVALARPLAVWIFADQKYSFLVPLVFAAVATEAVSVLLIEYARARNMIRFLCIFQIGLTVGRSLALLILAVLHVELLGLIGVLAAASLASALSMLLCAARDSGWPIFLTTRLKQFLQFSVPLIPVAALLWVIGSIDQYLITHILGLSEAAVYSVSRTLGGLVGLFTAPITFVVYPTLCRAWERQDTARVRSALRTSVQTMLALALPAGVALCLLSRQLLTLLATSRYIAPGVIVLMIGIGSVFLGVFQLHMYILLLQGKPRVVAVLVGVAALCNVVLNLLLIPRLGLVGAALAALLSYLLLAGLGMLWVGAGWRYFPDIVFLGKLLLATGAMGGIVILIRGSGLASLLLSMSAGGVVFLVVFALLRPVPGSLRQWFQLFVSSRHAPRDVVPLVSEQEGEEEHSDRDAHDGA